MTLRLYSATCTFSVPRHRPLRTSVRRCCSSVRGSLGIPFTDKNARYYQHLQTAVDVVERACNLCVDVQRSLYSSDEKVIQKVDRTPVTIADFGVQALVSLELGKAFPSIPLVAEEDSGFVRKNNLEDAIVEVVRENLTIRHQELTQDEVLKAIDRGGNEAFLFGPEPTTYWILDPIDGTRGFVNGGGALYVVGLALVVDGEIVLGVMGCPNWQDSDSDILNNEDRLEENSFSGYGIIMIAHLGCGTWRSRLGRRQQLANSWTICSVDEVQQVQKARWCIPESQTWESLPLSKHFSATTHPDIVGENKILLLPTCCGSLCKYLMVATGRASVFINRAKATTIIKAKVSNLVPPHWKLHSSPVELLGFDIKVWDHAVGVICIHEAGGKVSDWEGRPLDFAADELRRRALFPSGGVLVTNKNLHSRILEMMSDT